MEERIKREVAKKVAGIRDSLLENYDLPVGEREVFETLVQFIEVRADELVEDLEHFVANPHLPEHRQIIRLLPQGSVFSGHREFSFEKLRAVIVFFASVLGAGRLSKTRANKLAFYSDFYHCKKRGKSISGASYKHLPHGPVISGYEGYLAELEKMGSIKIDGSPVSDTGSFINSSDGSWRETLTEDEKETCREVLKRYGKLNAAEISERSHLEAAWKNTRTGELISYGYSELLEDLDQ